jgi:hypothetical protein
MTMSLIGLVPHVQLDSAKTVTAHFLDFQPTARQSERIDAGLDRLQRRSGIQQRAEQHVSADSASTLQVGCFHGVFCAKFARLLEPMSVPMTLFWTASRLL